MTPLVLGTTVVEVFNEVGDIEQERAPDFMLMCVDITSLDPRPEVGWVYDSGAKTFSAPPVFVPSRVQQKQIAAVGGCQIVSANAALSATYHADGDRWLMMVQEANHIALFQEFSGGFMPFVWKAQSGDVSFSTTADFLSIVKAVAGWLTKWQAFVDERIDAPPALPVTVS